ncbi:MAG: DNA mismatch repair protein MutL [Bdellovibrio sp.]|nr:MAG: DNA mismatch repair protein MutL [Bdellovibrio sp.]
MNVEISRVIELPTEVVNQIAAGEVVERPAHLLKELVENSLDAKATEIQVDLNDGGRSIRVADNGFGIAADELRLALARHTTSKIRQADDLWNLSSFGFRGEALASISSVSRLRLISRRRQRQQQQQDEEEAGGAMIESHFGQLQEVERINAPAGTSVEVRELFVNVPARLKFLKSPGAEVGAARQGFKALALAHSRVSFFLRVGGNLDLIYGPVDSAIDRARQVLEIQGLRYLEAREGSYKLVASFATPDQVLRTAKGIWLFAQGRWIQDRGVQAAVVEAFRGTLMHGEYPIVTVWLEVPPDEIDVNIHPTKSQVKFQNPSFVFRFVHHALRRELEKSTRGYAAHANSQTSRPRAADPSDADRAVADPAVVENLTFVSPELSSANFQQKSTYVEDRRRASAAKAAAPTWAVHPTPTPAASPQTPSVSPSHWSRLQVLAQSHLTYLLAQSGDELVLIDQHAAHERILFERLMNQWRNGQGERQVLLIPLTLDLSAEKIEALLAQKSEFERLGLTLETCGPTTIGISSLLSFCRESALPPLLDQAASEILEQGGSYSFERHVGDIAARIACHSAIRAGQAISLAEMETLLRQMDEQPFSQYCPHGRPVFVHWPRAEIERQFGRRP